MQVRFVKVQISFPFYKSGCYFKHSAEIQMRIKQTVWVSILGEEAACLLDASALGQSVGCPVQQAVVVCRADFPVFHDVKSLRYCGHHSDLIDTSANIDSTAL